MARLSVTGDFRNFDRYLVSRMFTQTQNLTPIGLRRWLPILAVAAA